MLLNELFLLELKYEDIPKTKYGYWINHEGKIIPVDSMMHGPIASRELGIKMDDFEQIYTDAYKAGWIRVVHEPQNPKDISADMSKEVSLKAKRTLTYFLRIFNTELERVWIVFQNLETGVVLEEHFGIPNAAGKAINWINQKTQGR